MLKRSTFMPNHTEIGSYNAIIFKGIQGVETGRLDPAEAVDIVIEDLLAELGDKVVNVID